MIIGIAIPSCIVILGVILTYGYISDVKNRQDYVLVADDLKENVLEIRRTEKNFLHYKDSDNKKIVQIAIAELNSYVKEVDQVTTGQIGADGFTLLSNAINKYSKLIDDLHNNYQKEQGVIKLVKGEGERLESVVTKKKRAQELTTSFILKLRLLEKNYIFYRDKASLLALNNGLIQIKNFTPFCFDCETYIQQVNKLFAAYRDSESIVNALQYTGNELEEISGVTAFKERQKIASFIDLTLNLLLVALAILCILGPFFVYKTASFIVAPIKRLSKIAKKISEGDISLRAPIKEHDETHYLAISFNTMLDHLQETQQSLNESLELLNEKQAQLVESEKRASLGFLVAGVAHELNNPLNNISLTAETMNADLETLSPEDMHDLIADIMSQSERAHTTVENLLDFARARQSADMEKQDITGVVNDSINLIANQLRISDIKLLKNIPDTSLFVYGNRSKLEQILISIITNSIQSMSASGTLTISVEPDNSKFVLIKIADTGHGIPENEIKNIFEPFYTTKPPGEGTGLGLSISSTLISEHKGEITVESEMDKGTLFTIKLPLYDISE